MTRQPAVVTGIGVVSPTGLGVEEHWRATLAGELAVRPIASFDASGYPVRLAGQVTGFEPADHVPDRLLIQTDRWAWIALAAAGMALQDADYDPAARDAYASSVVLASGSGGNEFGQREIAALWSRGRQAVSAYQSIGWFYAASTGQLSIRHGIKGPSSVLVSDAAGGLDSIGWARRVIRRGTPGVLAGGTEAPLSPYALICQAAGLCLSQATSPHAAYKPFDRGANGFVPGEGGAVLIVENAASASARDAPRVYCEVAGYAATHDAFHYEQNAPDGAQYARALRLALADAGTVPADVDLFIADGAGVPALDAAEAAAVREVFGPFGVPVTAPQGLTGRLCAGGAAMSAANALLAIRDAVLPPVGNLDDPDPAYQLDLVTEARQAPVRTVLIGARGHGGFNSALVLRHPGGDR